MIPYYVEDDYVEDGYVEDVVWGPWGVTSLYVSRPLRSRPLRRTIHCNIVVARAVVVARVVVRRRPPWDPRSSASSPLGPLAGIGRSHRNSVL